ncbi:sialate O-acetylesterase [Flavobacterium ovatum]|uniref:sialate O-acetylesterase n=1 Tax=Flavobacterium ovatum TaxID=1928857 RepID=UPI00344D9A4E
MKINNEFKIIVLLFLTFISNEVKGQKAISKNAILQIVLLGGQSNMAGHGIMADVKPEDIQRIEAVKNRVSVVIDGRDAQPLSYFKADKIATEFGPELFIGLTLAEKNPYKQYLLIKEAVGGTTLYGAWNPDWTAEKANAAELDEKRKQMQLYKKHSTSIHKCLDALRSENKKYVIIGMAWMQGETDTRKDFTAVAYEANLKRLIESYRSEFKLPKMPFIIGQINCPPRQYIEGVEIVRTAMVNVAKNVSDTEIILTSMNSDYKDFPKRSDKVHYDALGQKNLGTAFAQKLLK